MTDQNQNTNEPKKTLQGAISNAIKMRALAFLQSPPEAKKKPSNAGLWLVWAAFNAGLFFTELASAVSVFLMLYGVRGLIYGIATFFSGWLFFMVHEVAFTRAYASKMQTIIAGVGMVTTAASTIFIGMATAIVNGLVVFKVVSLINPTILAIIEVSLLVILIAGVGWQVILLATYFFTDPGLIAIRKYAAGLATNDSMRKNLSLAKDQAEDLIAVTNDIEAMAQENKEDIVNEIYGQMTGRTIKVSPNGNGTGDHPSQAG